MRIVLTECGEMSKTTVDGVCFDRLIFLDGNAIFKEFDDIVGYIGDEANKDDCKREYNDFDYNDTPELV